VTVTSEVTVTCVKSHYLLPCLALSSSCFLLSLDTAVHRWVFCFYKYGFFVGTTFSIDAEHLLHVVNDKEFILLHDGHIITSTPYFSAFHVSSSLSGN